MRRVTWSRRIAIVRPTLILCVVVGLALIFLVSRLAPSPVRPPKPVFVASGDWEPFVGSDLTGGGPVARLVSEVLQRQGYAPEVTFTTWSLAEQRTGSGAAIGGFPFVGSDSRRDEFLLSDPLLDFDYVLFVRRGDRAALAVDKSADLADLDVAHIAGYDYWPELEAAVAEFVEYPSAAAAFAALAAGEVDVVPEGRESGEAILSSPSYSGDATDIVPLPAGDNPLLGSREALYFMLPPSDDNRRFLAAFNRSLALVKATDLYTETLAALDSRGGNDELELRSVGGVGLAVLRDRTGRSVVTPVGTRVRVVAWPAEFSEGVDSVSDRPIDVQVKVLDGPSQGRIMSVDARALVIGDSAP